MIIKIYLQIFRFVAFFGGVQSTFGHKQLCRKTQLSIKRVFSYTILAPIYTYDFLGVNIKTIKYVWGFI